MYFWGNIQTSQRILRKFIKMGIRPSKRPNTQKAKWFKRPNTQEAEWVNDGNSTK